MNNRVLLFLDSGAFSAWTQKTEINLQEYIDFIKKYENYIEIYAGLDVIGNAEKTYENQLEMERQGLNPIVAFHKGEDFKWLKLYLENYDYIAIGGIADKDSRVNKQRFLDKTWNIICKTHDWSNLCKVHGFGIGSYSLVQRYPWYSIDSTSAFKHAIYGEVAVPQYINGKFLYNKRPKMLDVSLKCESRKNIGQHIINISEMERRVVLKYLKQTDLKLGKSDNDLEMISTNQQTPKGNIWKRKRYYFPISPNYPDLEFMKEKGVTKFLLSYFPLIDMKPEKQKKAMERIHRISLDEELKNE